jgi:hypothetical protein
MGMDQREFETPTLKYLKETCDATDEEFFVLYLHHKGITRMNNPNVHAWRQYMQYFCIEQWQDCVAALNEGYDTVGVNWRDTPWKHYSGNMWWSRASYIRKLPEWKWFRDVGYDYQFKDLVTDDHGMYKMDNELWIGLADPKAACLHDSGGLLYGTHYGPEKYRKDR